MNFEEKTRKAFGDRLREVRLEIGLSQEQLAHKAGLDRGYVNSVENGKRNVSLVNIVRIAKALGVSAAKFFSQVT
jgi:transcriptional regulator with XRE-family HTH domain